jgi:hypothetical protein
MVLTRAKAKKRKVCSVCDEPQDPEQFPQLTERCEHAPTTCHDCVQQWVAARLEDTQLDRIRCPECAVMLQYSDLQTNLDKELFER